LNKGIDASQEVARITQKLLGAGYSFVCRYYSHNPSKDLSIQEAKDLSKAGLYIVTVWETLADEAIQLHGGKGIQDATDAYRKALECGQPPGTPIYFAVDFDARPRDFPAIERYFHGVRSALGQMNGPKYDVGIYGSGLACQHLLDQGLVEYTWLAMSKGWADSSFADWNIKQLEGATIGGISVDTNESNGHGGGWRL